MRSFLPILGVILIAGGLILWYVPVQTITSPVAVVPSGYGLVTQRVAPYAYLTPSIPLSASWTSDSSIDVQVYSCGSDSSCSDVNVRRKPPRATISP